MSNNIYITEIKIKKAIKEATGALIRARKLVADGKEVPRDLVPRLENVIADLEDQLKRFIEHGY